MHVHDHGQRGGEGSRARRQKALAWALAVTGVFAVVEVAGGLITGSLALIADAGHMVVDVLALGLGLFAAWMAGRPTTPRKTYGYHRVEILAALANGAVLVGVALWIAWEAIGRLSDPPVVESGLMLVVAAGGLLANLIAAAILLRSGSDNLNVRGALLDTLSDALGSVGAIIAGVVMYATGWRQADAVASLVIAVLILIGSWRLLRETVDVLLEGTPARISIPELERSMLAVPGIATVHDIHVWTVTSGFVAMSGHAELDGTHDTHSVLDAATTMLSRQFGIAHITIQPETRLHASDCCEVVCEPERTRPVATTVAPR